MTIVGLAGESQTRTQSPSLVRKSLIISMKIMMTMLMLMMASIMRRSWQWELNWQRRQQEQLQVRSSRQDVRLLPQPERTEPGRTAEYAGLACRGGRPIFLMSFSTIMVVTIINVISIITIIANVLIIIMVVTLLPQVEHISDSDSDSAVSSAIEVKTRIWK